MKNFESIQYPKTPTTATHFVNKSSKFFEGSTAPIGIVSTGIKKISINTQVVVLEDSVGYENAWHKVMLPDEFGIQGYIPKADISRKNDTKEFADSNLDIQYNPDPTKPEIKWRYERKNNLIDDAKNGL